MSRRVRYILIGIIIIAGIAAGITTYLEQSVSMNNFIAISNGEGATAVAAWYDNEETVIAQIGTDGKISKYASFDTADNDTMYTVEGIATGTGGAVYMLRNQVDAYTGNVIEQQLVVFDFSGWRGELKKVFVLTDELENYTYKFVNVSSDTVTVIGTDMYESTAVRKNYEFGSLLADTLTLKTTRVYPLSEGEGIYQAIGSGTNLVYVSDSGKVFVATEETVTEVYPARELETLIYPTFVAYAETGYVYMGEHETGNVIKLNLTDGSEEVLQSGSSPLNGATIYTSRDFETMSMVDLNTYVALVSSKVSSNFQILITDAGITNVVSNISYGYTTTAIRVAQLWLYYGLGILIVFGLLMWFISIVNNGRTIMARLLVVTIPLIMVALGTFGWIAYNYYESSIETNFEKQMLDEGNMLTALFGQESFNEIQYPYDFNGEAYAYLENQLATRDIYARVMYYENGDIYVGVDESSPCFYPAGILMNKDAESLYTQAAITGQAVTGTIEDAKGERFVCVTPVGGLSGQTVYLLETGVFTANINSYMESYIGNFVIICISYLLIILIFLGISFYRVLLPISEIKWSMDRYIEGNKDERIDVVSEDELSSISNVFNKMADDYQIQTYNLRKTTETYYHFVPTGIIGLLEKDNLADLTLGSKIRGIYITLKAILDIPDDMSPEVVERVTNKFFEVVNHFSLVKEIVPIVDSSDLRIITMLCKDVTGEALGIALASLAKIDADNALVPIGEECKMRFVIHKSDSLFTICGDEKRYLPILFTPDLDELAVHDPYFRDTGSRIILTADAMEDAREMESYAHRYISKISLANKDLGIYDVYDDRTTGEIKVIKQTSHTFNKAIDLFEEGYYYEAKNMFSMVYRENTDDQIAKAFIFKCEELQQQL